MLYLPLTSWRDRLLERVKQLEDMFSCYAITDSQFVDHGKKLVGYACDYCTTNEKCRNTLFGLKWRTCWKECP